MKTNFTFRTDSQLKDDFVSKAKDNGTTATALFQQWMRDYIDGTDNAHTISTDTAHTNCTDEVTKDWEGFIYDEITQQLESRMEVISNGLVALVEQKIKEELDQDTAHTNGTDTAHTNGTDTAHTNGTDTAHTNGTGNTPDSTSPPLVKAKDADLYELSQSKLAQRLGCAKSSLNRQIKKGDISFAQWSKSKDPDGLTWCFDPYNKGCYARPLQNAHC